MKSKLYIQALAQVALQGLKTVKIGLAQVASQVPICKIYLESLEDKNPCSNNGNTPLHFAASHGHLEICKLFLNYDIEINPKNNRKRTPHALARENGHMEVISLFNDASANRRT